MKLSFIITLALCCAAITSCSNEPESSRYVYDPSTDPAHSTTERHIKTIENELFDLLDNYNSVLDYPYDVSTYKIDKTIEDIENENPDIFWLDGYSITTYGHSKYGCEIEFMILDDLSPEQCRQMRQELNSTADSIISQIPPDSDDYEKILFVHDYIVDHCEYDHDGADSDDNGIWGTAYGCLVNGSAICQGYSEAFLLLMNRLGIEAGICSGKTFDTDEGSGGHAWNYVKIDDEYYWLDVTWDDPTTNSEPMLSHDYFLINDDILSKTRTIDSDQDFIPECTSLDNNYFVRNNAYMTEYDLDLIRQAFETQGTSSQRYELMFADTETYQYAVDMLFEGGDIWELSDLLTIDDSISYSTSDELNIINICNF